MILAIWLLLTLAPFGFAWVLFGRRTLREWWRDVSDQWVIGVRAIRMGTTFPNFMWEIAYQIDVWANVAYADFLAVHFTKGELIHPFGRLGQTISFVLGGAKKQGSLTAFGVALCWILNAIDPNHVEKAFLYMN